MNQHDRVNLNRVHSLRRTRSSRSERRGTAAVEFALVAPILLLVVMATVEFGRGMLVKQVLTNASRVAAREASLPNSTSAEVTTSATNYALSSGVSGVTVTVDPSPTVATAGDSITVSVSVNFDDVSWLPSAWFLGGVNLQASSVMRKEGFE
ncbi:MAG: pilus assembly protein [Planctomycetales bacterium]|nr:pilus assembly protein [Planctomycetales bacterium]